MAPEEIKMMDAAVAKIVATMEACNITLIETMPGHGNFCYQYEYQYKNGKGIATRVVEKAKD